MFGRADELGHSKGRKRIIAYCGAEGQECYPTLMKRTLFLALLASLTSACGILYTDVRGPRAYRSSTPSEVKAAPTDEIVTGQSCAQSVLFLVAWGDAGYAAACRDALGAHQDSVLYDVKSDAQVTSVLLGIYTKACTRVTGKAARP